MPPDISVTPEPDTGSRHTARAARSKKSLWGLLIAVLGGGAIAFGLVQLIPDNWRIDVGKNSKPRKKPRANRQPANLQLGKGGSTKRAVLPVERNPVRKPSPPRTREDHEAVKLLEQAKALIAEGKKDDAIDLLEQIRNQYPGTTSEPEAVKLLTGG